MKLQQTNILTIGNNMKSSSTPVKMLDEGIIRESIEYYYQIALKTCREAKKWYSEEFHATARHCYDIDPTFSVLHWCGVISALSPNTNWQKNKEFALLLATLTNKSIIDAEQLYASGIRCLFRLNLLESSILKVLNGAKTSHFFLNGAYPHLETGATLDSHMGQIMCPEIKGSTSFTKTSYHVAKEIFCRIAREKGMLSHELQAMVWCAKVHKNKRN